VAAERHDLSDDGQQPAPGAATALAPGLWQLDLAFRGRAGVVAAFLLASDDEAALIECGPASTLPALLAGIAHTGVDPKHLRHLLVSHIHLDHSGAAGQLAARFPNLAVRVHPAGAPHLVDPARLLASAGRLYGDRMDDLWGQTLPVPAAQVAPLADGETLAVAGRVLTALHTPGHAGHHIAYWDPVRADLFTGDVGGARMAGTAYACPPAPPPELDPDAWAASVDRLRALAPRRLLLTHGGPFTDVDPHLAQLMPNLEELRQLALAALRAGADADRLTALIHDHVAARLVPAPPAALENLEWATPSYLAAAGLTRLLVKRGEVPKPAS
jgi:glyoxylase-like metal-dependent hydrolase (beta-lactamase superfamily II)